MSASKAQTTLDTQAIISIVAGTASVVQEYQTAVFVTYRCASCMAIYWKLTANKAKYLELYPYCPKCGSKTQLDDILEDHEVGGAEVVFLQQNNQAYASFKTREKALSTPNIKRMV